MTVKHGLLASLTLAMAIASTGCANKTNAQLDGALSQNEQLKKELDAERRARQEADARANMAASQVAPPPTDAIPTPGMEGTGAPLDLSAGAPGVTPRAGRTPAAADADGVTSSRNARGEEVLGISGDVLFDSGRATLKPTAKRILDGVATRLKNQHGGQQIRIEGHTDPTPVKKTAWEDNWDLGAARANAVRSYLADKGVKNMYIASFAATNLKNARNQALNRRVDIVIVRNGR